MDYLREENGGKWRKIAILILKKLTFAGFREIMRSTGSIVDVTLCRSPDWKTADEAEEDEDMYEEDFVHSFISRINAI